MKDFEPAEEITISTDRYLQGTGVSRPLNPLQLSEKEISFPAQHTQAPSFYYNAEEQKTHHQLHKILGTSKRRCAVCTEIRKLRIAPRWPSRATVARPWTENGGKLEMYYCCCCSLQLSLCTPDAAHGPNRVLNCLPYSLEAGKTTLSSRPAPSAIEPSKK